MYMGIYGGTFPMQCRVREIRHILILNYDVCFTLNGAKLRYISKDRINFPQSFDEKYWWIHAEITKIWRLQKIKSIMTDIDHRWSKSVIQGDGKPSGWCKVVIRFLRAMYFRHTLNLRPQKPHIFIIYFIVQFIQLSRYSQTFSSSLNYDTTWQLDTDRALVICLTWSTQR